MVVTNASSHGLGGWWRPLGHSGKLHHEAQGFWLLSEEGVCSNAQELSSVKLTVNAGPVDAFMFLMKGENPY